MNRIFNFLIVLLFMNVALVGCIAEEQPEETFVPIFVGFSADTLGRDVDQAPSVDFNEQFDDAKIVLWVASGCSGCHDWTKLIQDRFYNTSDLDNVTMLYMHRYATYESPTSIMDRYGDQSSEYYAPWPVLLPTEDTQIWDQRTKKDSDASIYEVFDRPGTPTIQIIDDQGALIWQSRTYWANESVFDEVLEQYWNVKQ